MSSVTVFVAYIVIRLIRILSLLMFVRAIMSWFPDVQGGKVYQILYYLTEPILGPIRNALQKIPALQNLPIDFSIIVAYLLLEILASFMSRLL